MSKKALIITLSSVLAIAIITGVGIFVNKDKIFKDSELPVATTPTVTPDVTAAPTISPTPSAKKETVILYFGAENGAKLAKEERAITVEKKEDIPLQIVKELIAGPKNQEFLKTVDAKTKVNSVNVKDFVATVDFKSDFISLNSGGSSKETFCLFSIVNSLAERNDIEKVVFSIDGAVIDSFGSFDLSEPLRMDDKV